MTAPIPSTLLILAVAWPLLVAVVATARPGPSRLVSWAALPALAAAALPEMEVRLPGLLLDGALVLNTTGRVFLAAGSILWLAAGLRRRQAGRGGDLVFLLAMAGGLVLPVAADAVVFYTAATVAGYAAYALLARGDDATPPMPQRGGRVLVVSLVAADLAVFELLLTLGHTAGSTGFTALGRTLAQMDGPGFALVLAVLGLGVRAGLAGVHFWLPPAFTAAPRGVAPALIAAMPLAGVLGWLRLLPLGAVQWPGVGTALQILAVITAGYAVVAAVLQAHRHGPGGYAVMAAAGLALLPLGHGLAQPEGWTGPTGAFLAWLPPAVLTMAALAAGRYGRIRLAPRHPPAMMPPAPAADAVAWAAGFIRRLAETGLPRWRGAAASAAVRLAQRLHWLRRTGDLEKRMVRWPVATTLLVLLALLVGVVAAV